MADIRLTVFCDYENTRWYASRHPVPACNDADHHFDPWMLGQRIQGRLRERTSTPANQTRIDLVQVRVYRAEPTHYHERKHYQWQRREWSKTYGDLVIEPLLKGQKGKPPWVGKAPRAARNGQHKQVHTKLSVDLLNWALAATSTDRQAEIAVLVSADRECAPVVREVAWRLPAGLVLAGCSSVSNETEWKWLDARVAKIVDQRLGLYLFPPESFHERGSRAAG